MAKKTASRFAAEVCLFFRIVSCAGTLYELNPDC